jgi:hypothetical protein
LNGKTGTTIWIDQPSGAASLSGNTIVGSAANPVLLVVNGDFNVSGNVTIYGFVFVSGVTSADTDFTGNSSVIGSMVTGDELNMSGNASITYNASEISAVKSSLTSSYNAKVSGSWKDF